MGSLFDPDFIPGALLWTHAPYFVAAAALVYIVRRVRRRADRLADTFERAVARHLARQEGTRTP